MPLEHLEALLPWNVSLESF